jgi:hypothetical protein
MPIIAVILMSANVILGVKAGPAASVARRLALAFLLLSAATNTVRGSAPDEEAAERAVASLVVPLEKQGFDFRADVWERELKPDLGKAVRLQLFKGNDYRVCIAVPAESGVEIEAHVLDDTGKPVEENIQGKGFGRTLQVKPKRTGVYVVTIRQSGGKKIPVTCALIMGYK